MYILNCLFTLHLVIPFGCNCVGKEVLLFLKFLIGLAFGTQPPRDDEPSMYFS